MISAADKKLLAAAIADSQASVYVIDARDTPAEQAKYIQLHKASMKPTLDKNHSIFFIHSPVSALKHKRWQRSMQKHINRQPREESRRKQLEKTNNQIQ